MLDNLIDAAQEALSNRRLNDTHKLLNQINEEELNLSQLFQVRSIEIDLNLLNLNYTEGLDLINTMLGHPSIKSSPYDYLNLLVKELEYQRQSGNLDVTKEKIAFFESEYDDLVDPNNPQDSKYKSLKLKSAFTQSQMYQQLGDTDNAEIFFKKAVNLAKQLDNNRALTSALNNLGTLYQMTGQIEKALSYYHKTQTLILQLDDSKDKYNKLANILNNIASAHGFRGHIQKAISTCLDGISYLDKFESVNLTPILYTNLGNLYQKSGRYKESIKILLEAVDLLKQNNNQFRLGVAYYELIKTSLILDNKSEAKTYLQQLEDICELVAIPYLSGLEKMGRALIFSKSDELRDRLEARELFREEITHPSGNYSLTALAYKELIEFNIMDISITGNQTLLETTEYYIHGFKELAEKRKAPIHICEALILEFNMEMFNGNLIIAKDKLKQGIETASKFQLEELEEEMIVLQEQFNRQYLNWKAMIESNTDISKEIENSQIKQILSALVAKYG